MSRDAWLTIRVSRDAHNYGAASPHFLGEEGQFNYKVTRNRIGQSEQLALELEISSPTRVDILALEAEVESETR